MIDNQSLGGLHFVRPIGLEPTQRKPPDPKSGASTNFATGAWSVCFGALAHCGWELLDVCAGPKPCAKVHSFCRKNKNIARFLQFRPCLSGIFRLFPLRFSLICRALFRVLSVVRHGLEAAQYVAARGVIVGILRMFRCEFGQCGEGVILE